MTPSFSNYADNWETERYELLSTRVCDLQFNFQDTLLNRCIQKLYSELSAKKIQYRPRYYFTCGGDEWGCTDRVPIIGIHSNLADSRLTRIEREMGIRPTTSPTSSPAPSRGGTRHQLRLRVVPDGGMGRDFR